MAPAATIDPVISRPISTATQRAMGGWVAPDGRMWRCTDRYHEDTAELLVRELGLRTDRDAGDVLADAGWLRISDNGLVLGARCLTQAQLDILFDLARRHRSMQRRLMDELERASERAINGRQPTGPRRPSRTRWVSPQIGAEIADAPVICRPAGSPIGTSCSNLPTASDPNQPRPELPDAWAPGGPPAVDGGVQRCFPPRAAADDV